MDRLIAMDKTETGLRQTNISWNDNDRQKKDEIERLIDTDKTETGWEETDTDKTETW